MFNLNVFTKEPPTKVQTERHYAELQAYIFEGDWIDMATNKQLQISPQRGWETALGHYWGQLGRQYYIYYVKFP